MTPMAINGLFMTDTCIIMQVKTMKVHDFGANNDRRSSAPKGDYKSYVK